jgi:hypothetical protein
MAVRCAKLGHLAQFWARSFRNFDRDGFPEEEIWSLCEAPEKLQVTHVHGRNDGGHHRGPVLRIQRLLLSNKFAQAFLILGERGNMMG